ncbi:ribosomal protein S21 [Rhizobium leguminosarum]|uniref:Small ribosomal subunit protein bS21 n=10 Tax=Rhizobium TaxID=379 RepID=A0A1C9HMA6_RHILT|nr:30S ribosomal protein S21 [Rhizobium leguminosarum bv. trifolii]MBA8832452.1 ribosomal protein S21 [Rhizobium leguminosarum]MDH6275073.1 ribosomal protein S21 [Rhizobium leguminosarum]
MQVLVRDNNVDQALRVLKKKMQREGLFREMKERRAYEKPSERRVREKAQAISRHRKAARKKMQREGLLAGSKRVATTRWQPFPTSPELRLLHSLKGQTMDELNSLTVSEERLEDCRDVVEPDLQDLIQRALTSGFSREEVLIAVSELVAEDFAMVMKTPSVH